MLKPDFSLSFSFGWVWPETVVSLPVSLSLRVWSWLRDGRSCSCGVDFVALEIIGSQVEIVVMPEFLKASFRALDTFTWSFFLSNASEAFARSLHKL